MRNAVGQVEKERALLVGPDPVDGLAGQLVVAVSARALFVFTIDAQLVVLRVEHLLVVAPEILRVVEVREPLVVEAEEAVEALLVRAAGMAGPSNEAPLADHAGPIAGLLQEHRDRDIAGPQSATVAGYRCVSHVLTGHQRAARRRADVVPGVVAGVAKALARHLIEPRRLDLLLAVAAKIPVAEVVSQDEDNVGLVPGGQRRRSKQADK